MNNKYLPIGTVCTVSKSNKKIMIIGYFSIEYNNNVTMYDYKGCVYPEGLLLPSQALSFNHDDIVGIDYIGFKNEQYDIFNNNLNREIEVEDINSKPVLNNFQFDENGVVIFDGSVNVTDEEQEEEKTIMNPFKVNYTENNNNEVASDQIFKFDENGVVISDGTENQDLNDNKEPRYQFDENGFVISDGNEIENIINNNDNTSGIKFDENGIVISDGTEEQNSNDNIEIDTNNSSISNIKFDENGMVISE